MNEISEEFEIHFYDGGNNDPENIPYLQSCVFDEKTTHTTSKGRNFSLILKLKDPSKYFSLNKIEICSPRGSSKSLRHCVIIFTKDEPFRYLKKFDDCVDEKTFNKIFRRIEVSERKRHLGGYFTSLLENVTEYGVSRNRKAFSDPSTRPKGRFINIKFVGPQDDEEKSISINSIKLFGEFLCEEEVMIDQMVSADEERMNFFLENEEWCHKFRIPLRSKTIRLCKLFLASSKYWNEIIDDKKDILEVLQYEELDVDEIIIRKMCSGDDDDHYDVPADDLFDYFRFFQLLGMKDFMLCIIKKIGGLDREALVSLYLKVGLAHPKGVFTLGLLNRLSISRFDLIDEYRAELEQQSGLLNLLLRHKSRNILFHDVFKNTFPVSTFKKASLRILKALYNHHDSRNLILVSSLDSPSSNSLKKNEEEEEDGEEVEYNSSSMEKKNHIKTEIKVHFEVLCWRSNFFSRMVSFGGTELESILSDNRITLELLSSRTLESYIYFLYHNKIRNMNDNTEQDVENSSMIQQDEKTVKNNSEMQDITQYEILGKLYTHGEMFCETELINKVLHWVRKNESFVRIGVREKFIRLYQKFLYRDVYLNLEPLERQVLTLSSGLFPRKEVLIESILNIDNNNKEEKEELNDPEKDEFIMDKFQKKEIEDWLVSGKNIFEKRVIIGGDKNGYAQWDGRRRRLGWKIEFNVDENGRCVGLSQNEGQWSDDGTKEVNGTLDKEGNLQLICNFVGGSYNGQKNAYIGVIDMETCEFHGTMVQLSVGKINAGSIGAHGTIGGSVVFLDE